MLETSSYQCCVFVEAESVRMQTEIVFQIVLDDQFNMVGKDLETMNLFDGCIVRKAVSLLEIGPESIDVLFDVLNRWKRESVIGRHW